MRLGLSLLVARQQLVWQKRIDVQTEEDEERLDLRMRDSYESVCTHSFSYLKFRFFKPFAFTLYSIN